jgi:ABC-type lipoprotein export system ATPase subunit
VPNALVEATGLYHIYRERDVETVALRGAELGLQPGSWTSLMGPSGSGKSTLLQILAGLLTPSAGTVRIGGDELTRMSSDERARCRRRRIGIVLQRDNLHPDLDVAGNIALPLRIDGQPSTVIRERVTALLDEVGLADRRHGRTNQISGGEAQRTALAVALAAEPDVLLADEPTGELDEETAAAVLDLIERARAAHGMTVVAVSHNPMVAERADRRLVMRDGLISDD